MKYLCYNLGTKNFIYEILFKNDNTNFEIIDSNSKELIYNGYQYNNKKSLITSDHLSIIEKFNFHENSSIIMMDGNSHIEYYLVFDPKENYNFNVEIDPELFKLSDLIIAKTDLEKTELLYRYYKSSELYDYFNKKNNIQIYNNLVDLLNSKDMIFYLLSKTNDEYFAWILIN